MRSLVLFMSLAACSGSGASSITSCPPSAPDGMACEGSLSCEYPRAGSRTRFCVCFADHMWCSDCSTSEYGFGPCTTGETCEYASWESDCSCSCTANGLWDCTSLDAVSPCPHDP